ncbi:MAG: AmmeMemoRadiSam system radical SAM enzyme [Desulfovibrionaceae bacterium]|nr:AmmeMemoRadiSam system radical SAM enzyme [Desulfovibrionaceae bacterium]
MNRAMLQRPLKNGRARCDLCSQRCVLEPGDRGLCAVRENRDGVLYSLVFDRVAALNLDPVEKKPLFHFLPGSQTLSLATQGCNLSCLFCQNAELSQGPKLGRPISGQKISPEEIVAEASEQGAASISYTYSEPTVFFELMLETSRLAAAQGLKNIMVSNGFQSPECLQALGPHIQAANIDLKAFSRKFYHEQCGARLEPVLDNLRAMRSLGWWLEVTTLVIPGLNDSEAELGDLAGFLAQELGAHTPWHVSRFRPSYRLQHLPPTPLATLERAVEIGRGRGLEHVYLGNVPGHRFGDTFCPGCGRVLIARRGFAVAGMFMDHGACPGCGRAVAGVWDGQGAAVLA